MFHGTPLESQFQWDFQLDQQTQCPQEEGPDFLPNWEGVFTLQAAQTCKDLRSLVFELTEEDRLLRRELHHLIRKNIYPHFQEECTPDFEDECGRHIEPAFDL
jgi:hypothetical protein